MDYEAEIKQAEADLAFAMAQGDGYREDEAAERLKNLTAAQYAAQEAGEHSGSWLL